MITFNRPDVKAVAPPALLDRGCVHVIGFESLRERAGERWEKARSAVYARLETVLRQRLGPADIFLPLDDVSYLVTMPSADSEDARIACLGAAYDLCSSYMRNCDLVAISLYRASQAGGGAVVLERIATEELTALAERAGVLGDSVKRQDQAIVTDASGAGTMDVRTHFVPMWDARNEAITLYICAPQMLTLRQNRSRTVLLQDLVPKARTEVELSCLQIAIETLARHLKRGERFLMAVEVTYETLNSHTARMEFTAACRELSSNFRQYLVFQLTNVPPGVPQGRLSDLVMAIKPYGRAVMAEIPSLCRTYESYQGIGLQAVGLDLQRSKLKSEDIASEIGKLSFAAKRLSLSTFLTGVSTAAALRGARRSNVHFMTGAAIAPVLAEPRPMTRLHWHEVMNAAGRSESAA